MNTDLVVTFIIILAFCIGFMVLYFSHKSGINRAESENIKIQEPNEQSKLVYEKNNLDARIKSLEDYLASDLTAGSNITEVRKVLITEQLAVMRRYSNVLAVRIALNGR